MVVSQPIVGVRVEGFLPYLHRAILIALCHADLTDDPQRVDIVNVVVFSTSLAKAGKLVQILLRLVGIARAKPGSAHLEQERHDSLIFIPKHSHDDEKSRLVRRTGVCMLPDHGLNISKCNVAICNALVVFTEFF